MTDENIKFGPWQMFNGEIPDGQAIIWAVGQSRKEANENSPWDARSIRWGDHILAVRLPIAETPTESLAFPPFHDPKTHPSGLTKREWFAGQAIAGISAGAAAEISEFGTTPELLEQTARASALLATMIADALIKELGKP